MRICLRNTYVDRVNSVDYQESKEGPTSTLLPRRDGERTQCEMWRCLFSSSYEGLGCVLAPLSHRRIYYDIDDHVRVERAWCTAMIISSVENWYIDGESTSVGIPCQTAFPGVSWRQWQLSWAVLKIIDQCSYCWLQVTASKNRFSGSSWYCTMSFDSAVPCPIRFFLTPDLNVSNIFVFSGISRKNKNIQTFMKLIEMVHYQ